MATCGALMWLVLLLLLWLLLLLLLLMLLLLLLLLLLMFLFLLLFQGRSGSGWGRLPHAKPRTIASSHRIRRQRSSMMRADEGTFAAHSASNVCCNSDGVPILKVLGLYSRAFNSQVCKSDNSVQSRSISSYDAPGRDPKSASHRA